MHHSMMVCLCSEAEHLVSGLTILTDSPAVQHMCLTVPKLSTASSPSQKDPCIVNSLLITIQCYIKMFRYCIHQLYWMFISSHLDWQQYFCLEGYACINLFLFSNSFLSPALSASTVFRKEATLRARLWLANANAAHADAIWSNRHCPVWKSTSFLFLVVFSVLLLMIKAVLKVNIFNCSKYKMTFVA